MYYSFLQFDSVPQIGFAHHFSSKEYSAHYKKTSRSFEIVCNIRGNFRMELYDRTYNILEGSIFLVFRDLPVHLYGIDKNNECFTVQVGMDYDLEIIKDINPPPDKEGIILPLVVPPGSKAEEIRRELISIITELERSSDLNTFAASLKVLGILQKMNAYAQNYRKEIRCSPSSEKISRQVKNYIEEHICEKISLEDIAENLNKTPNYINSCFRQVNGITIAKYIGREKVLRIAEIMQISGTPFEEACRKVCVNNISYGYRLFKQYMGVTPAEYKRSEIILKEKRA
ncbi:MAG: helix-turn-helix transcriptional regulator [Clostridia bacterium]|nr:helix-turn-helix transcriptional regulator [Clostridia bacterium]